MRKCLQRALKNRAAAATVSSMSAAVCAALTKPASYKAGHQALRAGAQCFIKAGLLQFMQRGQAAGGGHRVAAERAGLVDGAKRRELLHH